MGSLDKLQAQLRGEKYREGSLDILQAKLRSEQYNNNIFSRKQANSFGNPFGSFQKLKSTIPQSTPVPSTEMPIATDEAQKQKDILFQLDKIKSEMPTRTITTTSYDSEKFAEELKKLKPVMMDYGTLKNIEPMQLTSNPYGGSTSIDWMKQQQPENLLSTENIKKFKANQGIFNIPLVEHKKEIPQDFLGALKISDIKKYGELADKKSANSFRANYNYGRLVQDEMTARNDWLKNPTELNNLKAEYITSVRKSFEQNNGKILADGNLVTKDVAGYLPQFQDQIKAGINGAVLPATAAFALGQAGPQIAIPEEIITVPTAAKLGYTAGVTKFSYDQARGAAYNNLIELGVSPETAKEMSKDEALISATLEAADTIADMATLGTGKLFGLLGKGGVKVTAKVLAKEGTEKLAETAFEKLLKTFGKYGLNVAGETVQEGVQEGVSIGIEKSAMNKEGLERQATFQDDTNRVLANAYQGTKISALFGGGTMIGTNLLNQGMQAAYAPTVVQNKSVANVENMPHRQETIITPLSNEIIPQKGNNEQTNLVIGKLRESIPQMQEEPAVIELKGSEFAKNEQGLVAQVSEFFNSIGNKIIRKDFGEIIIDAAGVQSDISHGIGRAKAATFAAVPDVIQKGRQIDYQKNWKGRGYDGYAFTAPIMLDGKRSYVTAVVKKSLNSNKFYLHEVLDGNGNLIYTKKEPSHIKIGTSTISSATGGLSSFITNISQANKGVKQQVSKINTKPLTQADLVKSAYEAKVKQQAKTKAETNPIDEPPNVNYTKYIVKVIYSK